MAKEIDVYGDWLGIKDLKGPPDYYQLLRVKRFDDDQDRIRRHYRKLNEHVRKYSSGEYAKQSQDLLNELARAMLCLTDLERKSEYDASLGRKQAGEGKKQTIGEILLRQGAINREQLEKAEQFAKTVGFSLRDALAQQKAVPQETLMQAHAESIGLPFLNLSDITIDESLFPKVSAVLARRHSFAPVMIDNGKLLLASPNELDLQVEEDLKLRIGMPVRPVICTPADINKVINEHYSKDAVDRELASRSDAPDEEEKKAPESSFGKALERFKKWSEKK